MLSYIIMCFVSRQPLTKSSRGYATACVIKIITRKGLYDLLHACNFDNVINLLLTFTTQFSSTTQFFDVKRPWEIFFECKYSIPWDTSRAKDNRNTICNLILELLSTYLSVPLGQYLYSKADFAPFSRQPKNGQMLECFKSLKKIVRMLGNNSNEQVWRSDNNKKHV